MIKKQNIRIALKKAIKKISSFILLLIFTITTIVGFPGTQNIARATVTNNAVLFDGINDYVNINDNNGSSVSTTGALTISAWLRPDVLDFTNAVPSGGNEGDYIYWMGKGDNSYDDGGNWEWAFRMYNSDSGQRPNRISFYVFNQEGSLGVGSFFQDTLTAEEWIHVVAKVDATKTYIYKNGVLRDSDMYKTSGTRALATAHIENGQVTSFTMDNYGSGYTQNDPPVVNLYNGGYNTRATATAHVDGNGQVYSITVNEGGGGSSYDTAPDVEIGINPENGEAPIRLGTSEQTADPETELDSALEGAIDDVTIYNRALTDYEIADIYDGNKPTNGIVAEYAANEGTGTTLTDSSGNNYNGTLKEGATWTTGGASLSKDQFGIRELYKTQSNGREWFSKWNNSSSRSWTDEENDPDDDEFWTQNKGHGSWSTDGNGTLKITGSNPEMYVISTDGQGNHTGDWGNVEITVYGKRVTDDNTDWGGIAAYARTNHMEETDYCDTRGYGGRFRYDGNTDFEKEVKHDTSYDAVAEKEQWANGMPYNEWIGYKYVVYDLADGNVKLEMYIDTTDGANGGNWVKVNEFIDDGANFGDNMTSCATGVASALRLTGSSTRSGSESSNPNLAVYFTATDVGTDGLLYKKASIREIEPDVNLAGQWKFNETAGSTAYDSSGNSVAGTVSGATWTTGKLDNALSFDGTDDYVSASGTTSLDITGNKITLMAWVKPAALGEKYIVSKFNGDSVTTGYNLLTDNSNNIRFRLGDGTNMKELILPHGMSTNTWYHIAAIYDGSVMKLYKNGVALSGSTSYSGNIASNTNAMNIGQRLGGSNKWNGLIDEVNIYSRALSISEILTAYNAGL